MYKFFNALLILTVLVSGFVLYSLEHATRGIEREIAATHRAIAAERETIKLLNAEWSSLTRPDRSGAAGAATSRPRKPPCIADRRAR